MFYKRLYASPGLKRKRRSIVRKLKQRKLMPNLYVITLPKNSDLLEFYQSFLLKQPFYDNKDNMPFIVGIANGYEEAVKLTTDIIMDVYNKTGSFDIRKFCLGD